MLLAVPVDDVLLPKSDGRLRCSILAGGTSLDGVVFREFVVGLDSLAGGCWESCPSSTAFCRSRYHFKMGQFDAAPEKPISLGLFGFRPCSWCGADSLTKLAYQGGD